MVYTLFMKNETRVVKVRVMFEGKVVEVDLPGPLSVFPAKSGKKGGKR
jgi:hypothetical protein